MVYQDAPHHAGGDRQEMRAVVPFNCLSVDQTEICLVDECRRLQAVSAALARHAGSRDSMELLVNERNQSLEGVGVALAPFEKQSGDVGLTLGDTAILGPFRRFKFLAGYTLSGVVAETTPGGFIAVAGAFVMLTYGAGNQYQSATTDRDGRFETRGCTTT